MSPFKVRTPKAPRGWVEVVDARGRIMRRWVYAARGRWVDTRRPHVNIGDAEVLKAAKAYCERLNAGGVARDRALREAQTQGRAQRSRESAMKPPAAVKPVRAHDARGTAREQPPGERRE